MEANGAKKLKRKEKLERRKAIDQVIKAASAHSDDLSSFAPFRHFDRNGLSVQLESGRGDKLSASLKQYIPNLLKENMEGPFGAEWATEWKVKKRDMVSPEARYIFVRRSGELAARETSMEGSDNSMVGFVHYRFCLEEEVPVVYVYEIQLESGVQGRGLGKFLMQLIELIARKSQMGAVVLTVQKANLVALNFYVSKLRYTISSISPSRVDPLAGLEKSYEILCKTFDQQAKDSLEDNRVTDATHLSVTVGMQRQLCGMHLSPFHIRIFLSTSIVLRLW